MKLILLLITINSVLCKCPPQNVISPCECDDVRDTITCKTTLNRISKIFKSISESLAPNQRHFKEVRLNQHRNEREFILEDNSFGDITFDTFFADKGIRKISSNAFNKTANKITTFHCVDCQLEHQPPKYHIENVFNQMTQLETLSTQFITEIPYLQSSKLANLLIKVHQNLIIKSSTFYNLNQLINLIIYETKILRIEKEAFKFSKNLDQRMRIRFDRCNLTDETFQSGSFDGAQRNLLISLKNVNINYINEDVFKPLLNENTRNIIDFWESKLDCSDCRNQWMIKQNKQAQILFPSCSGSNRLFDEEIKNQLNLKCE